jgi:hypothetical protein
MFPAPGLPSTWQCIRHLKQEEGLVWMPFAETCSGWAPAARSDGATIRTR